MPTKTKTTKKKPARRKVTASKKLPAPATAEAAYDNFQAASDAASLAFRDWENAKARENPPAAPVLAPRAKVCVHLHPHTACFFQPEAVAPYSTIGYGPAGSDAHQTAHDCIKRLEGDGAEVEVKRFDESGKEIA